MQEELNIIEEEQKEYEREKANRITGKQYYFLDDSIHGITEVRPSYSRSWFDNQSNKYHHITKIPEDDYYMYYTTNNYKYNSFKPKKFVKFIHLEDSIPYGLKVYSQFTNVEQDERIFLQKNF